MRFRLHFFLPPIVFAAKDNNYYPSGNPNVDNPLYWSDAQNVLNDIAEFQSLYIKVSGCV